MKLLPSLLLLPLFAGSAVADSCSDLSAAHVPGAKVTGAQSIPAGQFTTPAQLAIPPEQLTVPAFCRVQLKIDTATSEVWLPQAWNGKVLGLGNGGELGAIIFDEINYAIWTGYVGVSSDLGHQSTSADASWALNHRHLIREFGHTATHGMTVAAKALAGLYYGSRPAHSYFFGGSAGGRQALMEAERYPADYDGIVSFYPAQGWTHIASGMIAQELKLGGSASSPAQLTTEQAMDLNRAVLAKCDKRDGLEDGLIADPSKCRFDPATLACSAPHAPATCLSAAQVTAVRALHRPFRLSSGKYVYPGLPYGSEYEWSCSVLHDQFNIQFANSWFQNEVFSDPHWDFHTFDPDIDVPRADKSLAGILNADSPDLDAFKAAGGKLIIAQGQSDAIVVPENTIRFYAKLSKRYGADTQGFARLFMEPGFGHCGPPPGPANWDPIPVIAAWVEDGAAPDSVVAVKDEGGGTPAMSRPLCPYPRQARYTGRGSIYDARNFACEAP